MPSNLGFLEAFLGLNTAGLTTGLAKAQASMRAAGKRMQSMSKAMSRAISLPLALIGGMAIKMAVDFEKSFSKIEGLVGIAANKVQAFKKDVLALAGPMAQAPGKLADAMFFITSAGLRGANALDVLGMSAKAAAANVGNVVVIADLVTSATNAYGIANLSAAQATNTLVAAVREGKRPPEEIAQSIGMVLPVASELAVTFQEVGAAIAAMSRTGTNASTAVTQLRQILFSILKPSEGAENAFIKMGTSSLQLKDMLAGEGGLIKLLEFLREKTTRSSNAFADAFPNIRALAGALDIMGKNAEENRGIFKRMTDNTGDLDKAFAAAAKTTSFKFKQALAGLKVEMIKLGDALLPIFNSFLDMISKVVKWIAGLSTETKKLSIVIGGILIVLPPLIGLFGSLLVVIGSLTLPIVAAIAAVVALGAAAIYLWDNWKALKERMSNWEIWWKSLTAKLLASFANLISWIIKGLNKLGALTGKDPIPNPFEKWAEYLEDASDISGLFQTKFKLFGETVRDVANKTKKALVGLFDIGGGGMPIPKIVSKTAIPKELGAIGGLGLPLPLPDKLEKVAQGLGAINSQVTELGTALQNVLNTAFQEFAETLGNLFTGDGGASGFFETLTGIIASFMKTLGQAAIAAGVAGIAFQSLFSNPFALVAAGVALIAAATVLKNVMKKGPQGNVQGLRSGGFVTEGGMFQLHKDETAFLPAGSAVTPQNVARGKGQTIRIVGHIANRVIKLAYDEEQRITRNTH